MNSYLYRFLVCIFGLLFFTCSVKAQLVEERFEQLTTKDGLSHHVIECILQDREGFMWFGTVNGLNKYDGYTFTIYQHNPSDPKRGLANNHITDLLESRSGNLWATTEAGLHHVNKRTGEITPYLINTTRSDERDTSFSLIEDREGHLWIRGLHGLNRFNPKTKKFTLYALPDSARIGDVIEDNGGKIWITTQKGFYQLDPQTKKFTLIPYNWLSSPAHIYKDAAGILWISGAAGSIDLYRFDPLSHQFRHYPLRQQGMTGELINSSNSILEESVDELWVGTRINRQAGLYRLNKTSGQFVAYSINPNLNRGLNSGSVVSLYKDRVGTLWIGTYNGINKLVRKPARFKTQPIISINPSIRLPINYISAVCEDRQGSIWLGNYSGGLYRYDRSSGDLTPYSIPVSEGKHSDVNALHADSSDTLWIAVREGDLYALTPDRQRFIRYPFETGITRRTITEDKQGRIWVAGQERIASLDRDRGTFTYYRYHPGDSASLPVRYPSSFCASHTGSIWIGTVNNGVFQFNPTTRKYFKLGSNNARASKQLNDSRIFSLYENPAGILWIGTAQSGLYRLDIKTNNFSDFTTKDGLPSNFIYAIQPDQRGNLWLATDRGLCLLDPSTGKTRIYKESDGLQDANFTEASTDTRKGHLLFGTFSGLMLFHPDSLPDNKRIPPVYITSLKVLGKEQALSKDTIELFHQDNFLSFDFVALNYDSPEKNQYAYQLGGVDKEWVKSGDRRFASYTNLDPGTYVFKVKGSNNDGVWNEQGTSLRIIIHPPWWQTWWAYAGYAIVFAGAICGFIEYRSRSLKRENQILEEKVIERTAEVVKQKEEILEINEELFQQKEEIAAQRDQVSLTLAQLQATQMQLIQKEKMASLGELTAGIAHEIQNPLNFVNNFSEVSAELLEELKQEIASDHKHDALAIVDDLAQNLQKIHHHGSRADGIVKGMLEHSRVSSGEKQFINIDSLIEEYLRLSYHGLRAKDKDFNANLLTDFDPSLGKVEVVPQDIGRVLLNLFNNAFYATAQKKAQLNGEYLPEVQVSTKAIGDKVQIIVRDNGTGIPETIKSKIFQPFFTTKPTGEGTGLGLSLSYDIITKGHGGELNVDSKRGEFSEFIIKLPIQAIMNEPITQ